MRKYIADKIFLFIVITISVALWALSLGILTSPIIFTILFGNHFILLYLVITWLPALLVGIMALLSTIFTLEELIS